MKFHPVPALVAGLLLAAMGHAQDAVPQGNFQQPIYKCPTAGGGVTYSQVRCDGAKDINAAPAATSTARYSTPPQDRAKAMRRAELTAQARQECEGLDATMLREQAML